MKTPFDFYFDFSSPYAYCASTCIDDLAAEFGRTVRWRPILLGPVFKQMGVLPVAQVPIKGGYALHDFARSAALFNIPYVQPAQFPISTVTAARSMLWIEKNLDDARARQFAHAVYSAYFAKQKDISNTDVVLALARDMGINADDLATGIQQDSLKTALKEQIEAATARGVFGAPFIFVDDEPFWGFDRFDHIRRWLRR
ncbi:MAG: 2-hydroxychromene-2-carboxylate isomerase [Paralcaligenes sp.]